MDMHHTIKQALEAIAATDDAPSGDVDEECSDTTVRAFSRWEEWEAFCKRVAGGRAIPSCVIDFNYQGSVERMYCFHDPVIASPENWLLVVHVHTQIPWAVRSTSSAGFGISKLTAVNARHASKGDPNSKFNQELGKFKIVPVSDKLEKGWETLLLQGKAKEMVWEHADPGSLPLLDKPFASRYHGLRMVIGVGEGLCHQSTITKSIKETEKTMRGGQNVQYIVAGLIDSTDSLGREVCTNYPSQRPLPTPAKPKILFVGINVSGKVELSLRDEFTKMRDALYAGLGEKYDDRVSLESDYFSTVDELIKLITRMRPTMVHLGCHGESNGLHFLQAFVNNRKLAQAFDALNKLAREKDEPEVRVAVINVCMSAKLSTELGQTVEFVIGNHHKLLDSDAISFTETFYRQLALGSRLLQGFKIAETGYNGYQLVAVKSNPDELVLFPIHQVQNMAMAKTKVAERILINVNIVSENHVQRKYMHAQLHEWLGNRKRDRIAVCGLGGSGKSTLCKLFVKDVYDGGEYDLVAFLRCAGEPSNIMLEDYTKLALKFSGSDKKRAELQAMSASDVRDYVHLLLETCSVRWLIVVDDAPHEDSLDGEDGMLRGYPWASGRTIVTSRSSVWDKDGKGVLVGEYEEAEAASWASSQVCGWENYPDDVRKLVVRLGCFPLAVSQAVHFSREQYLLPLDCIEQMNSSNGRKWLEKNLEKYKRCMKGKRETDLYPFSFVEVVNLSVMTLIQSDADDSVDALRLLRTMSYMHPAAITMELFSSEEKSHVELLKSQSLVVDSGEAQCVVMHPLTQEVVREFMMGDCMYGCIGRLVEVLYDKIKRLDVNKKSTFLLGWRYHKHVEHLINIMMCKKDIATKKQVPSWMDPLLNVCDIISTFLARVACLYASSLKMMIAALQWRIIRFGHDHVDVAKTQENMAIVYQQQGEYAKALEIYQNVLEVKRRVFGHEHVDVARSIWGIAMVLEMQGKYEEALEKYNEVLRIQTKSLGHEHVDVARTYGNMANVYKQQGEHAKALEYNQKCLEIFCKALGHDHVDVARTYGNMANVYRSQGEYAKALENFQRVLEIFCKAFGHDHVDVATTYNNMGMVYDSQGEYAKALDKYKESLRIKIKVLGHDHVDVAATLMGMANVYQRQGEYAKALETHEESLHIKIKVLGHVHVDVARTYNNMGVVYDSQGEYAKALENYEESLRIKIKVLGHDHVDVAATLMGMANVYQRQGEYAKALENYAVALRIQEKGYGHEHVDVAATYNNMGSVYDSQGEYAKALEKYEESLRIKIKVLGHDHVDVAKTYKNMGNVYYSLGEYTRALEYHQKDLDISCKALGHDHVDVAATYCNMAVVYEGQGLYDQALEYFQKDLDISCKALGHDHVDVATTLNNMAVVYKQQGEYAKALDKYEKSLRIKIKVLGHEHVDVATTLMNIGNVYQRQGEYAKALETHEESLRIKIKVLGHEHVDVAKTYNNMAIVYQGQGEYAKALDKYEKSLRIKIKVLGHEHVDVARTLMHVANVYQRQGEYAKALEKYGESLSIQIKVFGNEHVDVADSICGIAVVLQRQGKYKEALEKYEEVLRIQTKVLGLDHVDVANTYCNVARVYIGQGKLDTARAELNRALDMTVRLAGNTFPIVSFIYYNLACCSAVQGDNVGCLELLEMAEKAGHLGGWLKIYAETDTMMDNVRDAQWYTKLWARVH